MRKHVIVSGEVQGVGFRYIARTQAKRFRISGYARNLSDGTVEVEIEGADPDIAKMLDWLANGPEWAVVSHIEVRDLESTGETEFRIISEHH